MKAERHKVSDHVPRHGPERFPMFESIYLFRPHTTRGSMGGLRAILMKVHDLGLESKPIIQDLKSKHDTIAAWWPRLQGNSLERSS